MFMEKTISLQIIKHEQTYFMLSIIIPIYKVEKTLDRCLQSVASQAIEDCEVIMVDDGSPDKCGEICELWVEKDKRFKVIHQKNCGLSAARNAGLAMATGDILTFVDSDDYLATGTLQPLITCMLNDKSIDILEYNVIRHCDANKQNSLGINDAEWHDVSDYWFRGHAYAHTYSWNKIYRRSVFSGVHFPIGRNFEDVHTLPLLLDNVRGKIVTTSHGYYHYIENPDGITQNAKNEDYQSLLDAHINFLNDNVNRMKEQETRYVAEYYAHVLNIQITAFSRYGSSVKLRSITSYTGKWSIAGNGTNIASKIKMAFAMTFGVKALCRLFRAAEAFVGR